MNKDRTISLFEDDFDDQLLLEQAFNALNFPRRRIYFPDGDAGIAYLNGKIRPDFPHFVRSAVAKVPL